MTKEEIIKKIAKIEAKNDAYMKQIDDENKKLCEKVDYFNNYFNSRLNYKSLVVWAMIFTYMIHFSGFIIFFINLARIIGKFNIDDDLTPFLDAIDKFIPFYNSNIVSFIICSVITVLIIPLVVEKLIISLSNISFKRTIPEIHSSPEKFIENLYHKTNFWDTLPCGCPAYLDILIAFVLGIIINVNKYFFPFLLSAIVIAIITSIFIVKILDNDAYQYKHLKLFTFEKEVKEKTEKFENQKNNFKAEIDDLKIKLQKIETAEKSETEYNQLLSEGITDLNKIKKLADDGSPSACFYMGKSLYQKWLKEVLTKAEKEELAKKTEKYLETPANQGNIEAKFLLLNVRTYTYSHNLEKWENILKELREIKQSEKLPEEYNNSYDSLIKAVIDVIDGFNKKSGSSSSYSSPPAKPDYTFCYYWDLGCSKTGGDCNGWCPNFYSAVASVQKGHEEYLRYYNSH